jgi:hypothetical protein
MLTSLLKALPAILALASAVIGLIKATQARKAGRNEIVVEGLEQASKRLDQMATIVASPVGDDEVQRRLRDAAF